MGSCLHHISVVTLTISKYFFPFSINSPVLWCHTRFIVSAVLLPIYLEQMQFMPGCLHIIINTPHFNAKPKLILTSKGINYSFLSIPRFFSSLSLNNFFIWIDCIPCLELPSLANKNTNITGNVLSQIIIIL